MTDASTASAWDLLVRRDDLSATTLLDTEVPTAGPGQVVLRTDRVGMTANNVTYAVMGDAMRYWDFFPAADHDGAPQGRVPLWGFADVVASTVDGIEEGMRVFGYLPTSSHLVVEPGNVGPHGFRDASAHRQHLPGVYNNFVAVTADPSYEADLEDLQILYRPLFMTSAMLADHITHHDAFGADAVVISSASSKTSYGTAFLLDGVHRIGLTSPGNRAFTEGLGCWDEVVTYDEIDSMASTSAVFVDVAGDAGVRRAVHERLEPVHSILVGAAHHDAPPDPEDAGDLPGATPTFFFAPDWIAKRSEDWGPGGVESHHAEAWSRFAPVVAGWVDIVLSTGPEGLRDAWLDALAGDVPPRDGPVIEFPAG